MDCLFFGRNKIEDGLVCFVVLNDALNNISVISVLLVEETGVPCRKSSTCNK
jgi:hypothetical protein